MRILLAALILLAGTGNAQESGGADRNSMGGSGGEKASPEAVVRRLESVMWEPLTGQLTWVVSVWDLHSDMSHPTGTERFIIHVKSGTIESKGETRKFQVPEDDLHALMDILSVYAMRSTIWWERYGDADREAPPEILPESPKDGTKDGTKDKPKGDGPEEKPKAAPTGKAIVLQQ